MKIRPGEIEKRVERMAAAIRDAGVKRTIQRLEIFRELARRTDHPSAEALFEALRTRLPTLSLDTVYRTLGLLDELGFVRRLGPRRESVRFDANPARHHHFVCLRCGKVQDFVARGLDEPRLPPSVARLGRVLDAHVEVRGVCCGCVARTKRTKEGRRR